MSTQDESPGVERIIAAPGSTEYEQQFRRQSSIAIQRIARMPLVRIVCGLLTLRYIVLVATASFFFVRSQWDVGFDAWEAIVSFACVMPLWWLISVQGRIAIYGELSTEHGLFAPRQDTHDEH